jgi:hypothetical protein
MGRRSRPVLASGRAAVAAGRARLRRRGRSRRRGVARRRHPLRPRNPQAARVRSTVTLARRRRWAHQGRSCPPPAAAAAEWPQIIAAVGLPGSRVSRLWSTAGVARSHRTVTRADRHGLDQLHARAGVRAAHPARRHPGRTRPRPGRPRPAFNQSLPITAKTTSHEPRTTAVSITSTKSYPCEMESTSIRLDRRRIGIQVYRITGQAWRKCRRSGS